MEYSHLFLAFSALACFLNVHNGICMNLGVCTGVGGTPMDNQKGAIHHPFSFRGGRCPLELHPLLGISSGMKYEVL